MAVADLRGLYMYNFKGFSQDNSICKDTVIQNIVSPLAVVYNVYFSEQNKETTCLSQQTEICTMLTGPNL